MWRRKGGRYIFRIIGGLTNGMEGFLPCGGGTYCVVGVIGVILLSLNGNVKWDLLCDMEEGIRYCQRFFFLKKYICCE